MGYAPTPQGIEAAFNDSPTALSLATSYEALHWAYAAEIAAGRVEIEWDWRVGQRGVYVARDGEIVMALIPVEG